MNCPEVWPESVSRWLLESAPVVCLLINSEGIVIKANSFSNELMGRNVCSVALNDIILTFGKSLDIESLRDAPEQTHRFSIQTRDELPESYLFHFFSSGANTVVIGRPDMDEIRLLRKEFLTLNNQLSTLTRELQKKNHELAELNQLKTLFLGMAAHDLRKPVSAILGYSEFLIDEASVRLNEEQIGFLNTIHTSTTLMRGLIDDFLDVAMIESGQLKLDLQRTDIREPIERSVGLMKIIARKRSVTIKTDEIHGIVRVWIDSPKIEQVLNNLVSNAIEHSPAGSNVTIGVVSEPDATVVSVTDRGTGIAPDEIDRLFAPFERGRNTRSKHGRHVGLGLAISKKIIEAHGGLLRVTSRLEEGSTFSFSLANATGGKE